jgi:hypothetical protein
MTTTTAKRPLHEIAREIKQTWKKPYFGAIPYLHAMSSLTNVEDSFGYDSGRSVVNYFLANASTFRGDDAKRIKNELKNLLK